MVGYTDFPGLINVIQKGLVTVHAGDVPEVVKQVCATNVSLCAYGADRVEGHAARSLASSQPFVKLCAKAPTQSFLSLGYTDSQAKMQATYQALQTIWPMVMVTMMVTKAKVQLPFMLPPIDHLIRDLKPVMTYTWEDSQGIHAHIEGTTVELGVIAGVSIGAGILMPALARTRQLSRRMTSSTHLATIDKACLLYAYDHGEAYPPTLEDLVQGGYVDAKVLTPDLKSDSFEGSECSDMLAHVTNCYLMSKSSLTSRTTCRQDGSRVAEIACCFWTVSRRLPWLGRFNKVE